jgi:Tfp pilus assembly PilM family ATPase
LHSRSISTGGEAFTRAIAHTLGLDLAQAEQFKKKFGLTLDKLEGRVFKAVKPILSNIVDEASRSMQFFEQQFNSKVDVIVVSGGSAKMPEIGTFLSKTFNVDTHIANPWQNISYPVGFQEDILNNAPDYATVIGLVLREEK